MALWGLCGSKSIIQLTAWTLPGLPSFPSSPLPPLQFFSLCLVETNQVFMGFGVRGGVRGPEVAPNVFALVLASPSCQRDLEEPGSIFLQAWDRAQPSPAGWVSSIRLQWKGHNPDLTCSLNQWAATWTIRRWLCGCFPMLLENSLLHTTFSPYIVPAGTPVLQSPLPFSLNAALL